MFLPWRHTQCHGEVRPWAALGSTRPGIEKVHSRAVSRRGGPGRRRQSRGVSHEARAGGEDRCLRFAAVAQISPQRARAALCRQGAAEAVSLFARRLLWTL